MPSIMIHLKVGYEIGKRLNLNSYDYYLGLLAPDAPNADSFAPKDERWSAHVRREDLKEWREELNIFYQKNKDKYPKYFLLGYYIHILTDIIFDDFFYFDIRKEIQKNNSIKLDGHEIMSKDMEKYYFEEFTNIKNILKSKNDTYQINNISEELLNHFKHKIINRAISTNNSKYITEDIIKKLVAKVQKEL